MLERLAYLKGPDELLRQLYSSDAFTQQERDDLAQWLASGEATGQTVASAIGQASARQEAHDKASPLPAAAEEAKPYLNKPALLEEARNALWPE